MEKNKADTAIYHSKDHAMVAKDKSASPALPKRERHSYEGKPLSALEKAKDIHKESIDPPG